MPRFTLLYDQGTLPVEIPDTAAVDWIEPSHVAPAEDPIAVVREALRNPVDGISLSAYTTDVKNVAIAINDKTRPVPHQHLLPPLLEALHENGISPQAVRFYIATGTHLPMPPSEYDRILPPEIYQRYQVVSHDCERDELIHLGNTSRGTPIWVNRAYYESDLKMVVGNIEPHHFAGFSGGYKTAAIGLVGRKTINPNHSMLVEPGAHIAEYENNPLRQDIEEIGDRLDVHIALNALLNDELRIVKAVFGSPRSVMRAGIPISRGICQVMLPAGKQFDIVIASVGGAPKDINFYQSQKALTHASLFTRTGGAILLAAACPEGSGSRAYEDFMRGVQSPDEVFVKFRQLGFRVGPHKAFQVARDAARVHIFLVSEMPPDFVSGLLMTPARSLDDAYQMALQRISPQPPDGKIHVAVLPHATNTIPYIQAE